MQLYYNQSNRKGKGQQNGESSGDGAEEVDAQQKKIVRRRQVQRCQHEKSDKQQKEPVSLQKRPPRRST